MSDDKVEEEKIEELIDDLRNMFMDLEMRVRLLEGSNPVDNSDAKFDPVAKSANQWDDFDEQQDKEEFSLYEKIRKAKEKLKGGEKGG